MQLEYKILWADDVEDNIETYSHPIKEFLEDEGFVSKIYPCGTKTELESAINQNMNYNLIILDFKFNDKPVGTDFIRYIREKNIYSTIILYTAAKDVKLPEEVYKSKVQNVYTLTKHEIADDRSLITNIIHYDLYKDLDINSMRGIAMAELANFDTDILDIIDKSDYEHKWEKIFDLITANRQKSCRDIITKSELFAVQAQDLIKMCEAIRKQNNIEELKDTILNSPKSSAIFSSAVRANFLNTILNETHTILHSQNDFKSKYREEIIDVRNELAHHQNLEGYTDSKLLTIRKNILKHRENLKEIRKLLVNENIVVY